MWSTISVQRRESSSSSANSEMNDVNFVSLPRTAAISRRDIESVSVI